MTQIMLIDAEHPEELRVAVLENGTLSEFDYESTLKKQNKGNIYLAKVTRVEPSLQAAFVEYGQNRQGFLSFSEICFYQFCRKCAFCFSHLHSVIVCYHAHYLIFFM